MPFSVIKALKTEILSQTHHFIIISLKKLQLHFEFEVVSAQCRMRVYLARAQLEQCEALLSQQSKCRPSLLHRLKKE